VTFNVFAKFVLLYIEFLMLIKSSTCFDLSLFSRLWKMVTDSLRKERYLATRIFRYFVIVVSIGKHIGHHTSPIWN